MKLLLATLFLLSIAWTSGDVKRTEDAESRSVIAHVAYDSPVAFEFGKSFNLDIDRDGNNDFMFTTVIIPDGSDIQTKYMVNAIGENEVLSIDGSTAINENGMDVSELGNVKWTENASEIIAQHENGTWTGTWSGDRDQYIGIKLVKDGKSYNGWVKVSIDQENAKAFVQGYAINRAPNGEIAAGQV
ncbi:MAG: hypothetical protein P8X57_06580 [Cyclobacteriaceae bacterium]